MLVEGLKVPTGANFTFGFVNALVDSTGTPVLTSQGAVDFYNPSDGGQGVGGASTTNDWAVTNSYSPSPVVALGTTFGAPGANADYNFLFPPYRTYSAQAIGAIASAMAGIRNRGLGHQQLHITASLYQDAVTRTGVNLDDDVYAPPRIWRTCRASAWASVVETRPAGLGPNAGAVSAKTDPPISRVRRAAGRADHSSLWSPALYRRRRLLLTSGRTSTLGVLGLPA
jgi:hypothetical protein